MQNFLHQENKTTPRISCKLLGQPTSIVTVSQDLLHSQERVYLT